MKHIKVITRVRDTSNSNIFISGKYIIFSKIIKLPIDNYSYPILKNYILQPAFVHRSMHATSSKYYKHHLLRCQEMEKKNIKKPKEKKPIHTSSSMDENASLCIVVDLLS